MKIDRRTLVAGVAGTAVVGLAGTASAQTTHRVTVVTRTSQWDPKEMTIKVGDTVQWLNTAPIPHIVCFDRSTARDPAHVVLPEGIEPFESPELKRGERFEYTFTVPGMYHYCCRYHEDLMMMGMITVEA